jgi:hypothetical protein
MAGDDHGEQVRTAGGSYGSDGFGRADGCGDLGVGAGLAARNVEEGAPDTLLEGSGPDVEGESSGGGGFAEVGEDKADGLGQTRLGRGEVAACPGAACPGEACPARPVPAIRRAAWGKRSRSSAAASASESAKRTAQRPRAVVATSRRPRGESVVA